MPLRVSSIGVCLCISQTVASSQFKFGAMDIMWEEKLVFVTSHSNEKTGIYTYPILEHLTQYQVSESSPYVNLSL